MENVKRHGDIKFLTNKGRRYYLASEPNYNSINFFSENLLATETKKNKYTWINSSIFEFKYYIWVK